MKIQTYDPKRTHKQNPDCPMRLAPAPGGGMYCIDCGAGILATVLDVHEGRNMLRDFLAQPDGHCTVDGTIKPGWWKDEKGRDRSPLDDPDCTFLLESDENPK